MNAEVGMQWINLRIAALWSYYQAGVAGSGTGAWMLPVDAVAATDTPSPCHTSSVPHLPLRHAHTETIL